MMNTKLFRFAPMIALSILFFMTVISMGGVDNDSVIDRSAIHNWSGSLMLLGSFVHMVTKMDWIKTVFTKPGKSLAKRVRRNRDVDLGLFIFGVICALSGWLMLVTDGGIYKLCRILHCSSGGVMMVLICIHLWLHRVWFVHTARQLFSPASKKLNPARYESRMAESYTYKNKSK